MVKAPGVVGNSSASALLRVPHCAAHPIDRTLRDKTLESRDFGTCLLGGKAMPGQGKNKEAVTLHQERGIPVPFPGEGNPVVG